MNRSDIIVFTVDRSYATRFQNQTDETVGYVMASIEKGKGFIMRQKDLGIMVFAPGMVTHAQLIQTGGIE